ncbi:hypothetical protein BDZ85DRAFT_259579 [Elsinoe ampelina]|uniref:Uncharacterized protein n=1 Tax=Elsinoe ampelina TaxID=302913 RepID=A0A6A6GH48_9PEZI|nr:hypothetical protein BDZ85DRAFT_259579 [Elsinoe ampelina]
MRRCKPDLRVLASTTPALDICFACPCETICPTSKAISLPSCAAIARCVWALTRRMARQSFVGRRLSVNIDYTSSCFQAKCNSSLPNSTTAWGDEQVRYS